MIDLTNLLEPTVTVEFTKGGDEYDFELAASFSSAALVSIAVSLKRIADLLEKNKNKSYPSPI